MEYLRNLEFAEEVATMHHEEKYPYYLTSGRTGPYRFQILVKKEFYDQYDAREFKFEDFKYNVLNCGLAYREPFTRNYSSTLEMTLTLKEGGAENAEAAARHFRSLDFIEWAKVDY
jgi:hypothetical protein